MQSYVRLHEGLGDARESEFWQAEADMLADAILLTFWDPDARLLREGPTDEWGYTQHTQAWGILTGLIPADALDDVVESLNTDKTLTPTTYYHRFYVAEALAKAGKLDQLWDTWLAPGGRLWSCTSRPGRSSRSRPVRTATPGVPGRPIAS